MYKTYSGRVRNGKPYISEAVTLPENAELIITVMEESPQGNMTEGKHNISSEERQANRAAFEEFFAGIAAIKDEPITDEDIDELLRNRVNIRREFDL